MTAPLEALRRLKAGGRPAAALAAFDRELKTDPGNVVVRSWRARLHLDAGRFAQARRDLDAALRAKPRPGPALPGGERHEWFLLRAGLRLLAGRGADGWKDLMQAYKVSPRLMAEYAEGGASVRGQDAANDSPFEREAHALSERSLVKRLDILLRRRSAPVWAWAWRGVLRRRLGEYDGAAADLERAWSAGLKTAMILSWKGEARLQTGDAGGMRDIERALKLPCAAWNFAWAGRVKVAYERSLDALKYFDAALKRDPANGWYYAWRGEARRILGVKEGMFADFERALASDPGLQYQAWVRAWRGGAYAEAGRFEEALTDLDLALERMPRYALAWKAKAQALRALGRREEWLKAFDRACALDPKYVEALASRPGPELAGFHADLDAILDAAPDEAAALRWRGFLRMMQGETAGAEADLTAALDSQPKDAWALAWRGQLRCARGDSAAGLADLDRAAALPAARASALSRRAKALLGLGRAREALADLDRAVAEDARFASAFFDRGCLRLMLADAPGAVADLRRAVLLDGQFVDAFATLALAEGLAGDAEAARGALDRARTLEPRRTADSARIWASFWEGRGQALTPVHREALSPGIR